MNLTEAALHYFDVPKWQPIWVKQDSSVSYPWKREGILDRDGVIREFNAHLDHRIAILTGAVSSIVVIDPDSKNGTKNGRENLAALIASNGGEWPVTLTATTKTGGKHYIFRHPGEGIRVTSRPLPNCPDVDVKGDGGNIKVYPSPGYSWDDHNVPVAAMPNWLCKIVVSGAVAKEVSSPDVDTIDPDTLAIELAFIERHLVYIDPDISEPDWRKVGAAIHQMTRGAPEGFAAFDAWSSKGTKYDEKSVQAKWSRYALDRPEGAAGRNTLIELASVRMAFSDLPASVSSTGLPGLPGLPGPVAPPLYPEPVDLFGTFAPPSLPSDIVPAVIEEYARSTAELMGVDAGGVAMAALAVCAAAIPDSITLRVKRHEDWYESARIWVALVGEPSTRKSPIIRKASRPLNRIDSKLWAEYSAAKAAWDSLTKDEKATAERPKMRRLRIEDTTMEAVQEILKDNDQGVLCLQDELSGWFGSMDKYSGGRGSAKDRGFWLQSFNGGAMVVDRVTRGSSYVPNVSVSMLGGIQPSVIRDLASDTVDDGLLQRLFPIILSSGTEGRDVPQPPATDAYEQTVASLYGLRTFPGRASLLFSEDAHVVRASVERRHFELRDTEVINPKFASHIGKLDGLFARLCIIFHCIEHRHALVLPSFVTAATAERVDQFMQTYLLRHAFAFYAGMLGITGDHDALTATAGYILARGATEITTRDMARGDTTMKALQPFEVTRTFERLSALGWMEVTAGPRPSSPAKGVINPRVHELFGAKAEEERRRRENVRNIMNKLAA